MGLAGPEAPTELRRWLRSADAEDKVFAGFALRRAGEKDVPAPGRVPAIETATGTALVRALGGGEWTADGEGHVAVPALLLALGDADASRTFSPGAGWRSSRTTRPSLPPT
jgi:hypothetical protein